MISPLASLLGLHSKKNKKNPKPFSHQGFPKDKDREGVEKKVGTVMMGRTSALKASPETGEGENEPIVRRQLRIGDKEISHDTS